MEPKLPHAVEPKTPIQEMTPEERIAKCSFIMLELEGVLTGGHAIMDAGGEEMIQTFRPDLAGIAAWRDAGRQLVIVARPELKAAPILAERLDCLYRPVTGGKDLIFKQTLFDLQYKRETACYFGRDMDDLPALTMAGLAVCPPESPDWVRQACHMVSRAPGGQGAVRELIDALLADYVPDHI